MTMTVLVMQQLSVTPKMLSILSYFGRRACHSKRGHKGGCKQHYSCWRWNCWNRWVGVLSASGLSEQIYWHHLSQWGWWRTFCRERWWTRWRRLKHLHRRWPTAKEAEEDSEPGYSLLLKSDLFIFRYLVFCFKIILGIKYHTFYDFEVYWYLGSKIAGILVSHYPSWLGLTDSLLCPWGKKSLSFSSNSLP